jgi:two-component system, chemotaxis family, chemotaxis protein CheY
MRFLIVEDEFVARLLLQRFLQPHGQVDMAANGREAVEAVRRALDEHLPYDLITLDVLLPHLNGRTALRRIRDLETARGLPLGQGARVIMATGQDDPETVLEAFAQQCDGFLAKPVDPHALLGLLAQFELLDPALVPPPLRRAAVPWKVTRKRLGLAGAPPPSPPAST